MAITSTIDPKTGLMTSNIPAPSTPPPAGSIGQYSPTTNVTSNAAGGNVSILGANTTSDPFGLNSGKGSLLTGNTVGGNLLPNFNTPTTPPTTQPATKPVTQPVTPITNPVTKPVTAPVTNAPTPSSAFQTGSNSGLLAQPNNPTTQPTTVIPQEKPAINTDFSNRNETTSGWTYDNTTGKWSNAITGKSDTYQNLANPAANNANVANDIASKYGINVPQAPGNPNTSSVALQDYTQNPNYISNNKQLDDTFQSMVNSINQKYSVLGQQAELQNKNQTNQTTSSLYRMGETNPNSSSVAQIGQLGEKNLAIEKSNEAAAQSEEIANAQNMIEGEKANLRTQSQNEMIAQQGAQKDENTRLQNQFNDAWSNINNSLAAVQSGQTISNDEKNGNLSRLSTMITQFGSGAFDGVDQSKLDDVAKSAGLLPGTIQKGLSTIKQLELQNRYKPMQLMDGSVVNVSYDKDGNPFTQVLFAAPVDTVVSGVMNGTIPPDLSGYTSEQKGAINMALAKKGFNMSQATEDWQATQTYLKNANSSQQIQLQQSVSNATGSLGKLEDLNTQANDLMKRSGITLFSSAQKKLALSGALGPDIKSAFTLLNSQVADLVNQMAKVESGGGAGTNAKLGLAEEQLSSDWDSKTLQDAINLAKENIGYRINSMNATTVMGGSNNNQYAPTGTVGGQTNGATGVTNMGWNY